MNENQISQKTKLRKESATEQDKINAALLLEIAKLKVAVIEGGGAE